MWCANLLPCHNRLAGMYRHTCQHKLWPYKHGTKTVADGLTFSR